LLIGITATSAVAAFASACGEESDYANNKRPPKPITITASINDGVVSVSPKTFGAGPVTLIVANLTERAHEVTLETDEIGGDSPGVRRESGPINPGDTAQLQADLGSGTYRVSVAGGGVEAAAIKVGAERPSAQNELLQP
jgi:hypothetical protein